MQVGIDATPKEYGKWFPLFPRATYTRVFVPPGGGAPTWGRAAIKTLPPSVTTVGVSWKDAVPVSAVVAFADQLPAGLTVDLTWRHEPEPDWPLDQYRTGWKQIATALQGHPNRDRIRLVNIHTLWASRHKHGVDWRAWMLPGVADVEGWDVYRDTTFDCYEPPESILGLPYLAALEFDTRWMLPELGATRCTWDTTGVARGKWFVDCCTFAAQFGCETVGLWCSGSQTESSLDYRPTDAPTAAAWQAVMVGAAQPEIWPAPTFD